MKNSEQCTYSQEAAVESSQTSFWDTDQSLLSSGTNTPAMSSEPESQMDGLKECQCGKETLGCSIHPNTKDEWIAFMQDSLAKIFHQVAVDQVLAKTRDLDYTEKSYAFPIHFSLDTCSWRTWQTSLLGAMAQCSEQSLETLPNEATIASGAVYQLPKLVLDINVIDGGVWPTPTVSDTIGGIAHDTQHKNNLYFRVNKKGERWSVKLKDAVHYQEKKILLMPMAQKSPTTEVIDQMGDQVRAIGRLNPQWVEWLMGWPIGHTELKR